MFTFHKKYFFLALLLFIIEVLIALYMNDRIVRPYVGDLLAVMLLYCLLKAFLKIPVLPAAIGTLVFAYVLEILQYFSLVDRLGLGHSQLARIVIGSSFEWIDLLAYTAGIAIVLVMEAKRTRSRQA